MKWPRRKSAAKREAYFNRAMKQIEEDPETALAYLAEASWGAVDYTARTRAVLEKKKKFTILATFLEASDLDALEVDDLTRYRLVMAKVDAASEIREPVLAFEGASEALEIYPSNSQPVDVAVRTLIWSTNSYDPADLATQVEANPALTDAFTTAYTKWHVRGKPSLGFRGSLKKTLKFAMRKLGIASERKEWK